MFIEPVIGDNDDEQPTAFRDSLELPQDQLNNPLDFMGFPYVPIADIPTPPSDFARHFRINAAVACAGLLP
jgi:hypothetical protein